MRTFKILFSISLILFLLRPGGAQQLDHILGDVIVEVKDDNSIPALILDLNQSGKLKSTIKAKQIVKKPLNLWLLSIDAAVDNEISFLNNVIKNSKVLQAQQNHLGSLRATIPNDPQFEDQWQYINNGQSGGIAGADIDMELAWDFGTGGTTSAGDEIVICIIDELFNGSHEDLVDNLWVNNAEIPNNNIDDDNNGYVDDYLGWHAINDNDGVFTSAGHGTQVTGVVGAKGNNNKGVSGVNWDTKMMIVYGGAQNGEASALASYAYPYQARLRYNNTNGAEGAFVVATNASWGVDYGDAANAPIWCDFYNELGKVGILNFGATINSNVDVDVDGDLPTTCESNYLVGVTNMNDDDMKVSGAGYGKVHIDLGAFGAGTYTVRGTNYGQFSGTSAATPHVAGTAALLYSANCPSFMNLVRQDPARAALAIKDYILHGVDPNDALKGITTTGGRLNANNAMKNFMETCSSCSEAFGFNADAITDASAIVSWMDQGNVGNVTIRIRNVENTNWTTLYNLNTPFTLDNLDACAIYEYQTITDCPGVNGAYSYSRRFKTDGCCDTPEDISFSVENGSATFVWGNVLAATNYQLEYRNINDEDWTVINVGTDKMYILNGIQNCEFYEARLRSQCSGMNNESSYSNVLNVNGDCGACTEDYCSFTPKNTSDEWIASVSIDGVFTNVSGVDQNGYGSYLGEFDIPLDAGSDYTINLAMAYSGSAFNEFFTVFIDFNQDGSFDSTEEIYANASPTQIPVSGEFMVPENALPGITRMRVIMRFETPSGPCDSGGFEFGEIEDYCVNINSNLDCPLDYAATIKDTTQTLINFQFPDDDRIETFIIEYKKEGEADFIQVTQPAIVSTFSIVGLQECTTYEYRSAIICSGLQLPFSGVKKVKTKCQSSTSDPNEQGNVAIYPNPSQGLINIATRNLNSILEVKLLSIQGKSLEVDKYKIDQDPNPVYNLNHLDSGVYFLIVKTSEGSEIVKWIKI